MIRFLRDADDFKRNMERQLSDAIEEAYISSGDALRVTADVSQARPVVIDALTGKVSGAGLIFAPRATRYVDARLVAFYKLPFKQRSRRITSGQMQGVPRYEVAAGFVPYGTDNGAMTAAMNAASLVSDPALRIVNIVRDMTVSTFTVPTGVKIVSANGSKITMSGGYIQLSDYSEVVGVELVESQIRSNTSSTIGARVIGNMFTNSTISPGANVGAIRLTGNAHYCEALWNDVNCNQGNAQGIITDLGRSNYIAFNRVRGLPDRDRLISMCGRYNVAEYNWLDGGLTGITGLISRTIGSYMRDSVVRNNWILNVTEEGMGTDSSSNPTLIACLDRVIVSGKSGTTAGTPGLQFARAASADITANTYWAMVLKCAADPTLEGLGFPIVSASGTTTVTATLPSRSLNDAMFNAIGTAGTILSIQIQCADNIFEGNYLYNIAETPISFFGAGYRNIARNNELEMCSNTLRNGYYFQVSAQTTTITGIGSSSATVSTDNTCAVMASYNMFYNNRTIAERYADKPTPIRFTTMSYGSDPSSYVGTLKGSDADGNTQAIDVQVIRDTRQVPIFTTTTPAYTVTALGGLEQVDAEYAWLERQQDADPMKRRHRSQRSITGNGSTTVFTLPHTLGVTPRLVQVLPTNAIAQPSGTLAVTVDASNVTLTYSVAPAAGTGLVSIDLEV